MGYKRLTLVVIVLVLITSICPVFAANADKENSIRTLDENGSEYADEMKLKNKTFEIVSNPTPEGVFTFKGINILSNRDIIVPTDWSKIKIFNSDGVELTIDNVTTTISTKELQIYSEAITSGQYTLVIKPNVISDTQGNLYHKKIRINFIIELQDSSNTFEIVSNPTPEGVFTFKGINILSNRDLMVPTDWSKIKIINSIGAELPIGYVTTTISSKELQVGSESITSGQYTLIIEPGVISDTQGNLYEREIRIEFYVVL